MPNRSDTSDLTYRHMILFTLQPGPTALSMQPAIIEFYLYIFQELLQYDTGFNQSQPFAHTTACLVNA